MLPATVMRMGFGTSCNAFTTKNCPAFPMTFKCPEDINVNENFVYNYLSLESNYLLNVNTKDFFVLF